MQDLLNEKHFDILCLTETLLKPDINALCMDNFNLFRCDRTHKGWGGVGILVNKCFKVTQLHMNNLATITENLNVEHLVLQVQIGFNKSFLVACIYRATKYDIAQLEHDSMTFELIVNNLMNSKKDFHILGDFNLPKPRHFKYFKPIIFNNSLTQLIH